MAREWKESTVGEEVDILLGFAFKSAAFATEPPGHRLLRGDNIKRGSLEWGEKARFWRTLTPELERYCLKAGDIVVGMDGSRVGENFACVSQEDLPALLVQRVACLRARGSIEQAYLRYLICNPEFTTYVKAVHTGTSIPHISGSQIGAYPILVPPRAEQRAIAAVLGALDDKIELNRRMCRTLEGIAEALFRSWFVDFLPVRAKAAGAKSFRGMPQAVFDALPSQFVDSPLGPIPKGWRVRPIGEVIDVVGGGTPCTEEPAYWEGGFHAFCTPKDMAGLPVSVLLKTERCLTDAGVARVSSGQLPRGTVLLSSRAPIGYLAIAELPVSVNQGIIAMRCPREIPNVYVLLWARANMDRIEANANGSTFQEISKRNFRPIPMLFPDSACLSAFGQITETIYQRIVAGEQQSGSLAALRDALLPKLVSGELRIRDVERIIGRCA